MTPTVIYARVRVPARPVAGTCPECRGELFMHLGDDGRVEVLCTGCVLFEPAADAPAPRAFGAADLPAPVQLLQPSDQAVYRVLQDLGGPLQPADVVEELARRTADFVSRDTVNHALARLKRAGQVRHRKHRGWAPT